MTPTQTGVFPTSTATPVTKDSQSPYPHIQGTYSGGATDYANYPLLYVFTLAITQQNQQSFQGTYAESFPADSYYSSNNGTVDQNGTIQFTITGSDSNGNQVTITYTGTAQSSGGLHGTWSNSNGVKGTWDASKTG